MTIITEQHVCSHCDATFTREPTRGQRPKWCSTACRLAGRVPTVKRFESTCAQCGIDYTGHGEKYCSLTCSAQSQVRPKPPKRARVDQRGPLTVAYAERDWQKVTAILLANTTRSGDCMLWNGPCRKKYPEVGVAGRRTPTHRLILEAKYGAPLGTQAAHHICATPMCINPEHLQPVTHADNTAEMLARSAYVTRIKELEDALRITSPNHQALDRVPLA